MKEMLHRFIAVLRPGTMFLIALIITGFFLNLLGATRWLVLFPNEFWHGKIWNIITYSFVPAGIVDIVWGPLWVFMIGLWIEKVWSPRELVVYSVLCVSGAGLVKVILFRIVATPSSAIGLYGTIPLILGLLVAWAKLFGHERVLFMGFWEMTIKQCACLLFCFDLLLMISSPCFGVINILTACLSPLVGWIYLSLRWKRQQAATIQTVDSNRIARLEL
jgi:membrane associated rhomboid family serine protease